MGARLKAYIRITSTSGYTGHLVIPAQEFNGSVVQCIVQGVLIIVIIILLTKQTLSQ